jgi:hypothetical protein
MSPDALDAGGRQSGGMNEQLTDGPRPPDSAAPPPEQRVNGVIPFVHVEDVERSIAFYYHLGFVVASIYTEDSRCGQSCVATELS